MRILHVTDCYLPRLGGIEMHVHDLAERQRRDGHDARILTTTPAGRKDTADPAWVHRVRYVGTAADLLADVDVVHVHVSVISPFAFGVARRTAAKALPTLVTVHSLWSHLGGLPAFGSAVAGLRWWPVRWSAVSEQAAETVRRVLGPGLPVLVLPNAVDPLAWRVSPMIPVAPTIVSVMRLARTKRPLPLARMLRQVRETLPASFPLQAVLIGDGPKRPALERYLDRHHMRDWVDLPGRQDRTAIRKVFARSSLYVAPAELESFGIAALEARCAGLPVVASSLGGVGTFITPEVDGLLAGTDQGLVDAMVRLLTDPSRASSIAAHNRTVDTGFDWRAACTRSLDAYESAARVARPGRTRVHQ